MPINHSEENYCNSFETQRNVLVHNVVGLGTMISKEENWEAGNGGMKGYSAQNSMIGD